jgi:hypothetical protein
MPSPLDAVTTYFLAKDGNRPFLIRRAFAEDAKLRMVVNTDAVVFPELAKGLAAIEDILGRRFANDFENVYTFCHDRPSAAHRRHFPGRWLVGMSANGNGPIRIGCGRYDWYFGRDGRCLVEQLVIAINEMQILPAAELEGAMGWLTGLPYPWCTPEEALGAMPSIQALAAIRPHLGQVRPMGAEPWQLPGHSPGRRMHRPHRSCALPAPLPSLPRGNFPLPLLGHGAKRMFVSWLRLIEQGNSPACSWWPCRAWKTRDSRAASSTCAPIPRREPWAWW